MTALGARAALAALTMTAVAACSGSSGGGDRAAADRKAADCNGSATSMLTVTQRYLDGLETTSRTGTTAPGPSPTADTADHSDQQQFAEAIRNIRAYATSHGCDPVAFQQVLSSGLQRLRTGGPVARAVLLQLRGPARNKAPGSAALRPGDDLASAVASAPSGSTVVLGAGTFVVDDTIAVLRGVTLRGAGRDRTRLQSAVAGGPVLVLTSEQVTFEDLTLLRTGTVPGPVVSAGPAATLVLRGARVSGARADAQGRGGIGVLMSGGPGGQTGPRRRTSLTVLDSELLDNAVAGVVVGGEHRARIERTLLARSGQCGVCFLGTSDGVVTHSRFVDNSAGIVAGGDGRPLIVATSITGGQVGVQAIDRSAPELRGVTVTGAARAAMIWTGTARGRVEGSRCVSDPFGIVVGPRALPFVGTNSCAVARGRS